MDKTVYGIHILYTVSRKNIPDIFDCNFKKSYQILIFLVWIFLNDCLASHLTQCLLLHYQENADQAKYALKYAKTWKNIPDIIDHNLKTPPDFNNFWFRYFWHNWLLNDYLSSHLTQLLLLHYLRKTNQANHGLKWMKNFNINFM